MSKIISIIAGWFQARKETVTPWLVDRDGRVYLPERRVVLKAKTTSGCIS